MSVKILLSPTVNAHRILCPAEAEENYYQQLASQAAVPALVDLPGLHNIWGNPRIYVELQTPDMNGN